MEKKGYRDALQFIEERFPDRGGISIKEASAFLGVSTETLYRAMKNKKNPIPHSKVGGSIIIPIPQLARWMC